MLSIPDIEKRFQQAGDTALFETEILAMLLSKVMPNRQAVKTAEAAIAEHKHLARLITLTDQQLSVALTDAGRDIIKLMLGFFLKVHSKDVEPGTQLCTPQAVAKYVQLKIGLKRQEHFLVLFLDNSNRVLGEETLFIGTAAEAKICPAIVLKQALARNATSVILVHNHPTGNATPSEDDRVLTKNLESAFQPLKMRVLDHIVACPTESYSIRGNGIIR